MKVQYKDEIYTLDAERAVHLGIMRKQETYNLSLTTDEVHVLSTILGRIGGDVDGARGCSDDILRKLMEFCVTDDCFYDMEISEENPAIYFKK